MATAGILLAGDKPDWTSVSIPRLIVLATKLLLELVRYLVQIAGVEDIVLRPGYWRDCHSARDDMPTACFYALGTSPA